MVEDASAAWRFAGAWVLIAQQACVLLAAGAAAFAGMGPGRPEAALDQTALETGELPIGFLSEDFSGGKIQ